MPRPRRSNAAPSESPDPLLLVAGDTPPPPRPATPQKRRPRAGTLQSTVAPAGTPGSNAMGGSVTSPTPRKKENRTPKGSMLVPDSSPSLANKRKRTAALDLDEPADHHEVVVKPQQPTFSESAKKVLPTPKKRTAPLGQQRPSTLPRAGGKSTSSFQPVKSTNADVGSPKAKGKGKATDAQISREAFLANEALKRQREARNFKYMGDANAPRQTRSGRVVVDAAERDVFDEPPSADEARDTLMDEMENPFLVPQEDEDMQVDEEPRPTPATPPYSPSEAVPPSTAVEPLPDFARPVILEVLQTLTSSGIADKPKPFHDELKNETLLGITKLLQGTIDRGEGNSALLTGPRGSGKTRTMARALSLLQSNAANAPIVVKLSGHVQTNDRLAIREMGRQIAVAEGKKPVEDETEPEEDAGGTDGEEYAPTTLPSHLLALLQAPSPRAIIIIMEEFDLFTEHARQALLYCLRKSDQLLLPEIEANVAVDVVQSVKTGPVETTGRGIAVIGITSRIDTLLLLEKRVKSRFSHRSWRTLSPVAPGGLGWPTLLRQALVPWSGEKPAKDHTREERKWRGDWEYAVDTLLDHHKIVKAFDRLTGLTTDVRSVYKPFIIPVTEILESKTDFMTIPQLAENILVQVELAGWGLQSEKLKGLPNTALVILIVVKHLHYAGREEFNFAQIEEEYLRFSRTKLVGSGKTRWPIDLLRGAFDHLLSISLLVPVSNANAQTRHAKVRCTLSPHEIVAWFKGDNANSLGPELTSWGRVMGGHA